MGVLMEQPLTSTSEPGSPARRQSKSKWQPRNSLLEPVPEAEIDAYFTKLQRLLHVTNTPGQGSDLLIDPKGRAKADR